jgi:hypothetical protein
VNGGSEDDIRSWVGAVASLHNNAVRDQDARAAAEAAANLWSGFGFLDAPTEVLEMLLQAIEAGYATALHDLRDGGLDEAVRAWCPEPPEPPHPTPTPANQRKQVAGSWATRPCSRPHRARSQPLGRRRCAPGRRPLP